MIIVNSFLIRQRFGCEYVNSRPRKGRAIATRFRQARGTMPLGHTQESIREHIVELNAKYYVEEKLRNYHSQSESKT